jgi:hypothetical protein
MNRYPFGVTTKLACLELHRVVFRVSLKRCSDGLKRGDDEYGKKNLHILCIENKIVEYL